MKAGRVIAYILIGILLIPVLALCLYLALGGSLFIVLYVYNRKKNGLMDIKEGKNYKIVSTILFIIGFLILFSMEKIHFFSWQSYLWIQLVTFIGLLPMCYFQYKRIKENK